MNSSQPIPELTPVAAPIRIGLVGVGRAGWGMHIPETGVRAERFTIVAAHDADLSRAEAVRRRLGSRVHADFNDLLSDSQVELVDIASTSPVHTMQTLRALEVGKLVFLEKPIALTYADALRLKAAADAHPGRLFFRHNRRFETAFVRIRQILATGTLGDIHSIKLRRQGFSRRDDWQTLIDCGGGQLNNWGPHLIDHALRLLESPVIDIWGDLKRIAAVGDAEDHFKIVLRGANGRVADIEVSGGTALSEPEYLINGNRGSLTCTGDTIVMKYLDPQIMLSKRKPIRESPPFAGDFGSPDPLPWISETIAASHTVSLDTTSIWDFLFEAVRHGTTFPITTDEAVEVVRISDYVKQNSIFAPPPAQSKNQPRASTAH